MAGSSSKREARARGCGPHDEALEGLGVHIEGRDGEGVCKVDDASHLLHHQPAAGPYSPKSAQVSSSQRLHNAHAALRRGGARRPMETASSGGHSSESWCARARGRSSSLRRDLRVAAELANRERGAHRLRADDLRDLLLEVLLDGEDEAGELLRPLVDELE
jgi:hypothetical protein